MPCGVLRRCFAILKMKGDTYEISRNADRCAALGVPTNDLEKTVAFYETIGFQPVLEIVNEAANERVTFLQLKNLVIETYENHAAVGKPGAIDHIALDTTDVEAAFAAAKEAGLTMLDDEIHGLPFWANGVKFFTVEGPNGEKVEFCQKL